MTNLRELFTEYHAGFQDFVPWLDHHIEMHRRHPLECAEFGAEWLRRWEAVGRLLELPAKAQYWGGARTWVWMTARGFAKTTAAKCLTMACAGNGHGQRRIVLLDGAIVKEWGTE